MTEEPYILNLWRAQSVGEDVSPETIIMIKDPFPRLGIEESDMAHEDGAEKLANALWRSLPGGTVDRLLAKLLLLTASSLVVARGKGDRK